MTLILLSSGEPLVLEDKLLICKFNRGDRNALCRIYEKYKGDLLRLAIALLNDPDAAEDVVNDTFVAFTRSMGKFRLTGSLKSYLSICAANLARNIYQTKQRQKTVGINEAAQVQTKANSPDESASDNEEYQHLCLAMAELPYAQREIIILHLQNDMSFSHIARLQNISVNTIKSRYRYGLEKLRSILKCEV